MVVEDDHISTGEGRCIIREQTVADVIHLQAFVPIEPIRAAKWPVPQQDIDVSLRNICMIFLQMKFLVQHVEIKQRGEEAEEGEEHEEVESWGFRWCHGNWEKKGTDYLYGARKEGRVDQRYNAFNRVTVQELQRVLRKTSTTDICHSF